MLKHHPDKKASTTSAVSNSLYLAGVNQNTNDDAFFKCIQKAHEVLTNPEKRRQFDSVDPIFLELEEDMPKPNEFKVCPPTDPTRLQTPTTYVLQRSYSPRTSISSKLSAQSSIFIPVSLKSNLSLALGISIPQRMRLKDFMISGTTLTVGEALSGLTRKSMKGATGMLGCIYIYIYRQGLMFFFFNASRDDKRYTEKKNKSERARRKKEDIARVRGLVDMALR